MPRVVFVLRDRDCWHPSHSLFLYLLLRPIWLLFHLFFSLVFKYLPQSLKYLGLHCKTDKPHIHQDLIWSFAFPLLMKILFFVNTLDDPSGQLFPVTFSHKNWIPHQMETSLCPFCNLRQKGHIVNYKRLIASWRQNARFSHFFCAQ